MSGLLREEFDPLATAGVKKMSKPEGELSENFWASWDAGLMNSSRSEERYIQDTWGPIVDEIESITGESFKNPGDFLYPNVFAIVTGEAERSYGDARYAYEARQIETYVRKNRDKLPEALAVSVLDSERDKVWREAARAKFAVEQKELADLTDRSPGVMAAAARLLGTLAAGVEDPLNQAFMAAPVGASKTFLGLMFREAVANAGIEAIQQPDIADWYKSLGIEYTWEDFAMNVGGAAGVGAAMPLGFRAVGAGARVGGKAVGLTGEKMRKGAELLSNYIVKRDGGKPASLTGAEILDDAARSVVETTPFVDTPQAGIEHKSRLRAAEIAVNNGEVPKLSDATRSQVEVPKDINDVGVRGAGAEKFDPRDILVDAKTFQFKEGGDEFGVTDRLAGVTEWDPIKAGTVIIYEYADGRLFIADGHQRVGLAKRIQEANPDQNVELLGFRIREADGVTPQDAMVIAALKNISEGSGSVVDAAKIARISPELLSGPDFPKASAFVRQARALANLDQRSWGMVVNEVIPPNFAASVGRLIPEDGDLQLAAMDVLAKTEPANEFQAETIIRQVMESGVTKETQENLFGEEMLTTSLFLERAKVLDRAVKQLRKDRGAFKNLITNAERLEGEGNQLARDANKRRANEDGKAIALLQSQANRKGELSDALTEAARRAKESGNFNAASRGFVDDVRRAIESGEFDRAEIGDARRAFDVAEEAPAIRSDNDQQSLDGFSDPYGKATDDQVRALSADLLEPIEAIDRAKSMPLRTDIPADPIIRLKDLDFADAKGIELQAKANQKFTSVDEIMERAERNHAELDSVIESSATSSGAVQKKAPLKGRDRVEEKLRDKYAGDMNRITDVARGGVTAETNEIADAFVEALSKRYQVIDEGYSFTPEGYFDRKLAVIFDDGQVGEVQIWPPGMLEAKEAGGGHDLYEISRSSEYSDAERAQAVLDMQKLYGDVAANLSQSWAELLGRQLPSGIEAPSRAVSDSTMSRVTSGERISRSTSEADIAPQVPSDLSDTILPGESSTAGMELSTRKNLIAASDEVVVFDDLESRLGADAEIPVGSRLDPDTNEIIPEFQTLRQMKDEFDQDAKMIERLKRCAL